MSQKTDNLIKLALVFFVSLLSFSIGTYVGKKYSDNQHKLALLEPQKESPVKTTEEFATEANAHEAEKQLNEVAAEGPTHTLPGTSEKPAALTDSEVAKIAEEFASEEEATEERIVATVEPTEKVVKTIPEQPLVSGQIHSPKATTLTAATIAQPKKADTITKPVTAKAAATLPPKVIPSRTDDTVAVTATPVDAENRNPASIPPTTEMVPIHYTVQIGSFPTEGEADTLTKSLQNKGYKTSYVPAKVNGQIWYRVNVGLFGTIKEAQDYKKEFLEKTKLTSAIVQRLQH
ncbi:MAG: rare lipoprotein precursor [Pseudobdellovibrio sp.]|jgi:cell division septation protein DedD|nr:rare lipoprotein precursor [Pseudobdellovibrio sp.]